MQIIPVLDLYKGEVVHAAGGNRKTYRAIDSKICASTAPTEVINAFLNLYDFKSIYLADLNALEHQHDNAKLIELIAIKYPDLEIWLDTGTKYVEHYLQLRKYPKLRMILSSESLSSSSIFISLLNSYPHHQFLLSLDYKADKLLGSQEILKLKQQWPRDVIVLNLSKVGINQGYSFPTDLDQQELVSGFNTYYGGGIRDVKDVRKLSALGYTGALISTALHNQTITSSDIDSFSQ
jgi:phosphoribosylformimino-5-aminoimidazole carboxamide ribotide isomerase